MVSIARNFSEIPSRGWKSAESPAAGWTKSYWMLAAISAARPDVVACALAAPAKRVKNNPLVIMIPLHVRRSGFAYRGLGGFPRGNAAIRSQYWTAQYWATQ